MKMPLSLTDTDLRELNAILAECRHKDAVAIINFLQPKMAVSEAKETPIDPTPLKEPEKQKDE
jgi:hypothetical protein